jgi:hypothetical protein
MKRPDAFYICGEFDALLTRDGVALCAGSRAEGGPCSPKRRSATAGDVVEVIPTAFRPGDLAGCAFSYANATTTIAQTSRNAMMRSALLEKSHSNMVFVLSPC